MVIFHIVASFIMVAGAFGAGIWFQKREFAKLEAKAKTAVADVVKKI